MTLNELAKAIKNTGFVTAVTGKEIKVSLTNRKPSQMEIETVLDQLFPGQTFNIKSVADAVKVWF